MKRVLIVGPSGSGKSTLARRLRDVLHLPLYHLDNIWWKDDKSHISRDEFDKALEKLLAKEEWIIDGDYSRTYRVRMEKADTIIFLDYPLELCLESAKNRVGTKRDDIPWIEEEFDPEFYQWILDWPKDKRPVLLSLLEEFKDKETFILHNRNEADELIEKLSIQ